jgi:flagellar motor switch protein FliM
LVIALEFEIDMKSARGQFRIAIPAEGLISKLEGFSGTSPTSASATVADTGRLEECSVEASVRFNETDLPSRTIVELTPGQVIRLEHPVDEPLTLYVGHVPYLSGLAGRRGAQKAFAVIGPTAKKGSEF